MQVGLYPEELIIGRAFAAEFWGAYFWEGLFLEEYIIGILWYFMSPTCINIKTVKPIPALEADTSPKQTLPQSGGLSSTYIHYKHFNLHFCVHLS